MEKVTARFWGKVKVSGPGQCWEWQASTNGNGYGKFSVNGKMRKAHRVAWELVNGSFPAKAVICHTCDNRKCVNPAHLFVGTQSDNMRDMYLKGREAPGQGRKITDQQARDVFERYHEGGLSQREIAQIYGVSQALIGGIVRGEKRKHALDAVR